MDCDVDGDCGVACDCDVSGGDDVSPVINEDGGCGEDSHNVTNDSSGGDRGGDDIAVDEWVWRGVMGVCDGDGGA